MQINIPNDIAMF